MSEDWSAVSKAINERMNALGLRQGELVERAHVSKAIVRELQTQRGRTTVAVHQIAKLDRLGTPGPNQPAWAALMARKRRKTLVVCRPCHEAIHATPVTHAA